MLPKTSTAEETLSDQVDKMTHSMNVSWIPWCLQNGLGSREGGYTLTLNKAHLPTTPAEHPQRPMLSP